VTRIPLVGVGTNEKLYELINVCVGSLTSTKDKAIS